MKLHEAAGWLQDGNRMATGCDEIRVVFDRYIEDSIKAQTKSKQTGNLPVHYRVLEETQIGHLDTKQFLYSIKNKE